MFFIKKPNKLNCVTYMLNEIFVLQTLIIITLFYFTTSVNVITLWYLSGIYLISSGCLLFLDDGDIFIGFLWIIDLGVGLIFFIFILHFSNFLHQKALFNISVKFFFLIFFFFFFFIFFFLFFFFFFFILIFFYYLFNTIDFNFNYNLKKIWFFFITWYDYYELFFARTVTDLNLLREMYFYNNSLEFFIINFSILYGIFGSINLTFLIKRIFNFLTVSQINNLFILHQINTNFFIRNQNFIRQQNTSTGTRVWVKNKTFNI